MRNTSLREFQLSDMNYTLIWSSRHYNAIILKASQQVQMNDLVENYVD